jgi:F-type H+-transporting ATPase subunit b
MPQLDLSVFPTQLFWLAVTFAILYLLMARGALPRIAQVLEDRQARISHDLDEAERLKAESEKIIAAYEAELAAGRAKSQSLMLEVRQNLAAAAASARAKLEVSLNDELKAAEAGILAAQQAALSQIDTAATEAAVDAITRLLGHAPDPASVIAAVKTASKGRA